VLGNLIKEKMITNAATSTAVNSAAQLNSPDPFSYVDDIMVGIMSAATAVQSWKSSIGMNMEGQLSVVPLRERVQPMQFMPRGQFP